MLVTVVDGTVSKKNELLFYDLRYKEHVELSIIKNI